MEIHGKATDPYRLFFPLGIVLGISGVSIWPLYHFGLTAGYSGRAHAFVQTDGFLFAFICGFLLTALPRFTGTQAPSRPVQYVLAAIVTACAAAFEFQYFAAGNALFLAAHMMLLALAARRFRRRQQNPPYTFPLVGIGMLAGLNGAVIDAGIAWNVIPPAWDLLGKRMLSEGLVLLLVLGIGGFLGPRLLGFAAMPNFNATAQRLKGLREERGRLMCAAAGVLIVVSLVAEYGFGQRWMAFTRAVVATLVILSTIQPWRLPAMRTTLAWCVWSGHLFVILSLWAAAVAPRYRIDLLHILFIGGFTLLILAVGTRVSLSHGGYDLALERASWPLRIGLATGLLAMLARVTAPFVPLSYFEHLAWGALLWIAGIVFWGIHVFRWTSNCQRNGGA